MNVARRSNTIKCQTCKKFGHNKCICQRNSNVGSIRGTKVVNSNFISFNCSCMCFSFWVSNSLLILYETRTGESSSVGACANVMNNVVENVVDDGLDATTQ